MSRYEPQTNFSTVLSPLGAGPGGDDDMEYINSRRGVRADGTVVIRVKPSDEANQPQDNKPVKKKTSKRGARRAAVKPMKLVGIQTGEWSTGLCNCCESCVPNCCMATCCPCVSVAQIATRLGYNYRTTLIVVGFLVLVEYAMFFATSVMMPTEDGSVPVPIHFGYSMTMILFSFFWRLRTKVREQSEIPGNRFHDWVITWLCSCCALAQMATHVKSYTPGSCGFGAPDELPAYDPESETA